MDKAGALTNLKKLPSELRNTVYYETTKPLEILEHPEGNKTTMLEYFCSLLPPLFQSDPQIANEATMALVRRTLQVVTKIKVPGPEYFDPVKSLGVQWNGVRHLEFTHIQHTYASPPASGTPAELTVHDIVSRCKKLENLTFSISADMMLKPIASDTQNNLDCAYILRVTEHPTLRQVVLNCHRGHKFYDQYKPPPTDDFEPFVKAFQQGTNLLGRNIEVKVDFSPGIDIATMGLETMRQYKNGFTWAVTMDWFG